ncbi:putative NAD(P)/FAD-binding protein YdhS [Roseiarcus fermentans]|uniref:Putative NAD(P)/FAD-binding protein YdhS n=1 Tax=Roseiarcus fermentans TaxID=1473586 RepID=A0A366FTY2_9HYPH|nr:FAD/NAD(P)-binding protein [Roseiarcus fermentans]RBP18143.1 putative NAD(P)/FAD-binding protein YdhS [Roseiarcus fermentans]
MSADRPTIAIVGGGFSGAAVAYHLAQAGAPANLVVFEPRARLGAGLAYGGDDPSHRINVPATRMSLLPDDRTHFARWLETSGTLAHDPGARSGADAFARRQDFGRYMDEALRPLASGARVRHVRAAVVSVRRSAGAWAVRDAVGDGIDADLVIVATTHPSPTVPAELDSLRGDPRLIPDALAGGALSRLTGEERVLLVGSGLTAADVVATLDACGHRGQVVMVSRRGLRSLGHAPRPFAAEGDFVSDPVRTASALVRNVRRAVQQAEAEGRTWHSVLDAVRTQGPSIWRTLTPEARKRVARRLRPYWDVHRFRAAPQIDTTLARKLEDRSLELRRARLGTAAAGPEGLTVELFDSRRGSATCETFDAIIVATGPSHREILQAQPYLRALAEQGHVALDEIGLGLEVSRKGRAVGASGRAEPTLLVAGPLARGTFGELMGLPEVSDYARFIAEQAFEELSLSLPRAGRRSVVSVGQDGP